MKTLQLGLVCFIASLLASFAQTVETLPDGVQLTLASGETVRVQVCADRIVHVTAQPKGAAAIPASYVIQHRWDQARFAVKKDDPAAVILTTGQLTIRIDKATGAVSFQDAQGAPILGEKDRSFTPVTVNKESTYQVEQRFHSPGDESLYGLGQYQDGHWNWKGIPLEFRQVNTQIAVPMLLSNKGYGLLWDNASMTEFNPVDTEVPLASATPIEDNPNAPKATEDLGKASAKKKQNTHVLRQGTFTTEAEGDYVFLASNGNRRDELSILVNGQAILELHNICLRRRPSR